MEHKNTLCSKMRSFFILQIIVHVFLTGLRKVKYFLAFCSLGSAVRSFSSKSQNFVTFTKKTI